MALRNPVKAYKQWRASRASTNVVPFPGSGQPTTTGPGVIPITRNGEPIPAHEFLQAQILNMPAEEESVQKKVFFGLMYFMATWVFAPVCGLLGFGLAQDLMQAFGLSDFYATTVCLVFGLLEIAADAVCALLGERLHQGLKTGGDLAYAFSATAAILLVQAGTALVQIAVLTNRDSQLAAHMGASLYLRAFAPLGLMILAVLITAGVQRRSLKRMITAIERKADALTSVAQASVHVLEAEMNARRAIDEHADTKARREQDARQLDEYHQEQRNAYNREQERLRKRDEDDGNGRLRRL